MLDAQVSMRLGWVGLVRREGDAWRTEAGAEAHGVKAICGVISGRVRAVCVVEWLEGCCPAEPVGAKGAKDYKRERVANKELWSQYGEEREGVIAPYLAERSEYHQEAAEEIICAGPGGACGLCNQLDLD
jgi:hypothetical protein